jgi:hypothetical protein
MRERRPSTYRSEEGIILGIFSSSLHKPTSTYV